MKPLPQFLEENKVNFKNESPYYGATTQKQLKENGYFMVIIGPEGMRRWQEVHAWCKKNFGKSYTWTGEKFWFDKQENAVFFKLKWG